MTSQNKAFTLIELLVVVAILGALAAIVVVPLVGNTFQARHAVMKSDIRTAQRIIGSLTAVEGVDWEHCTSETDEGRQLRRLVDKHSTSGTNYTYAPQCFRKWKHCGGHDIGSAYLTPHFQGIPNLVSTESGCVSSIGSGGLWQRGDDHTLMLYLTGTNSEGVRITTCIDTYGIETTLPYGHWNVGNAGKDLVQNFIRGRQGCCDLFWQNEVNIRKCQDGYDYIGNGKWVK